MTSPPPQPLDEFGLIARYLAPLAIHAGARGLQDDVAILEAGSIVGDLVINTDAVVAGVHFLQKETPSVIAERVLRVNLSDLAAKGAKPLGYQLTLALTGAEDETWIAGFAEGLLANQNAFEWSLLGGDTVRTPGPLTISVTALGTVPTGKHLSRSGARPGDDVWVTGWIGDGALGLSLALGNAPELSRKAAVDADRKFRLPEPRIAFGGRLLASGLASASADVSDGLIGDLAHIASASKIGIQIDAASVPLSAAGHAAILQDSAWLHRLLTGGDDYEIIFTAPPSAADRLAAIGRETGTPLSRIGVTDNSRTGVAIRSANGELFTPPQQGYRHF